MIYKGSVLFIGINTLMAFTVYFSIISIWLLVSSGSLALPLSSLTLIYDIIIFLLISYVSISKGIKTITINNRIISISKVFNRFTSVNYGSDYTILQKKWLWVKAYPILNGNNQKVLRISNYEIIKKQRSDFDCAIDKLKSLNIKSV